MGFSDIINAVDNQTARKDALESFSKSRDAWFTYVGGLTAFGVLLGDTPVAAVRLARTIAARADFHGKLYLIGAKAGLPEHLPFFKAPGEFAFNDGVLSCKMELTASPPGGLALLVARSGDRQGAEKISCTHYFQVEPFGSEQLSFAQFTSVSEQPQRVTYYFEHMLWAQPFACLPFYRNPQTLEQLPPPVKTYWSRAYAKAAACEKLVTLCQSALVLPVEDGGEVPLLLLGLAALGILPADKAVVLVDFSGGTSSVLQLFAQKKPEQWPDALCQQFPSATREQLQKALIPSLVKLHGQLGSRLSSIHFSQHLEKETVQPGHLYLCALKDAPADYRDVIYAQAKLPAVLASPESACVSICAGLPYLCPVESAYPVTHGAAGAQRLLALARPLANPISLYLSGVSMELDQEAAALSAFFQETLNGTDTAAVQYCKAWGKFAEDPQNQRLEQAAAIAYTYTMETTQQTAATFMDGQAELEALYHKLVAGIVDNKLLLSHILPESRAARYLNTLTGSGEPLCFEVKKEDVTRLFYELDDPEREPGLGDIVSVTVWNAKTRLGGTDITASLRFSNSGANEQLTTTLSGLAVGEYTLDGMPWLRFENVEFELSISEDGSIAAGRFGASVKGTELHLLMTLGADGSRRLQGSFSKPITAMDAYYALAGGVDFVKALPPALQTLADIGLESVTFQLDGQNFAVTYMEFVLITKDAWTLWEQDGRPLITLRPRLGVAVTSPQDLQNRLTTVTVSGDCAFGAGGEAGVLRLTGSYSPFTVGMSLLSPLKLGLLLEMFGVNAGFQADITTLEVFANPSASYYFLQAVVQGDWKLSEQFVVTGLGLELSTWEGGKSVAFSGLLCVCTVQVGVAVRWSSGAGWDLLAKLSTGGGLTMSDLVKAYGGNHAVLPNTAENDPPLGSLTVRYSTGSKDWSILASVEDWYIPFLDMTVSASAKVACKKKQLQCSLDATLCWNSIELAVGYSYLQGQNSFYFSWNSFSGSISGGIGTLTIHDFSLGSMVEAMVGWVTGAPFGLEAPWDVLGAIQFKELTLTYNFNTGDVSMQATATLDLGFARVEGVKLAYVAHPANKKKRQAQVTLLGSFPWNTGENALGNTASLGPWDAATPGAAPAPDGKGNAYFDLRLLALGQRAGLFPVVPLTVDDAMERLYRYDPEMIPPYDPSAGWLVGADFGILRDKNSGLYLLNVKLLFCDPSLFAMRITCDSAAAKLFKGLRFDILYCKISDTIGLYKACVTLPDRMRYFDIGAYSLTLPCFSVEIYTNGDFKLDVGFPYKGDFSRSFSISGQIGIIPFVGAAGFYFGKLSSLTAASSGIYLPATADGLFNPAIVFGIGLRFGIGKRLDAGILKAGFSLTFSAILEGVFAKFNPYGDKPVDWYYSLTGAAAIHGEIYGSIDFVILSASVNLRVGVEVAFALVAYRAARFTVSAYIEASARLVINLGLFKIKLSFSFSFHVQESFTVGSDSLAPWDGHSLPVFSPRRAQIAGLDFSRFKPGSRAALDAQLSLPLTVANDEWGSGAGRLCAIALLTVSAAAFRTLAEKVTCWVVAAGLSAPVTEEELLNCTVDAAYLAELETLLAAGTSVAWEDADGFLGACCTVEVAGKALLAQNGELDGVLFPIPPALTLTLEDDGETQYSYQLDDFSGVSPQALESMRTEFDRLAVVVEEEGARRVGRRLAAAPEISMARWLLIDYIRLLARQAVKSLRTQAEKGSQPLGQLLAALQEASVWSQLGGMVSRYQLHGLRIPTQGISARTAGGWSAEGKFPPELGVWSLCGAELPVTQKSRVVFGKGALPCSWLGLPKDYALAVDAGLAGDLAALAKKGFSPPMTLTPGQPERIPLSISFGKPMRLDGQTAWSVPRGFPRGMGHFTLELLSAREQEGFRLRRTGATDFQTAALVEFTVKKTQTPNVFLIAGAAERYAALLSQAIAQRLSVAECRLAGWDCPLLSVMQMDLSTETHPPVADGPPNPWSAFIRTLWEAFVTNNGGYILAARPVQPFPDSLFNDRGEGVLTLVAAYQGVAVENPAVNAVLYDGAVGEDAILHAVSEAQSSLVAPGVESTPSYINAQWSVARADPAASTHGSGAEELLDSSYTLLRYSVNNTGGFPASGGSMPVGPDKSWRYSFTLPADTYLGGADYTAAGKRLSVQLEWLDLYGNRFPAPTQYSTVCGYMDGLLGLSRYPGVTAQWSVLPGGLCVALSFDRQACMRQASAASFYRRALAQLGDPNGVDLCLLSPLFPGPVAFSTGQCAQLLAWVEAIGQTVAGMAHAPGGLALAFALGKLPENQGLFPLTCAVILTRRGAPAQGFEKVDSVRCVTWEIPLPTDVKQFACDLESTLGMLRVLKGRDQLFALRADLVRVQFKEKSCYGMFAPRPVTNTLRAESAVKLYAYASGKGLAEGEAKSYTGVDLNVWMKNALAMVDAAFTPLAAGAAAALEQAKPDMSGYNQLLAAKKELANHLAQLLSPVFAASPAQGLQAAREAFRQRLLSRLSNLYDVRAVVTATADVAGRIDNARLYGGIDAETTPCGMTLSPAKITLRDGSAACAFTISGSDLVRGENGEIIPYADFDLTYGVTHLETEIRPLVDGFESSAWLQGVTKPILTAHMGRISVPFPLYTFPEIPIMQDHGQLPAGDDSCCAYRFTYSNTVHYPQLLPHVTVKYNLSPGMCRFRGGADSLFTALARFDAVGSVVVEDICGAAERINASQSLPDPSSADAVVFSAAMHALLTLVQELARAPLSAAPRAQAQGECIRFTLAQGTLEGALTVTVCTDGASQEEARAIVPQVGLAGYAPVLVSSGPEGFTYVYEDSKKARLPSALGQLVKERTLTLPPRKILVFRNAMAEMYAQQNRCLVPGCETAPEFVFTTGNTAFSGPAAATAAITEEKDIRTYLQGGQADTLTNCLLGLFAAYIGEAKAVTVQAECRYLHILGGEPSVAVEQPVFLQTPVDIANGNVRAMLQGWVKTVAAWRGDFPPDRREWLDSQGLHFAVTFTDAGNPVLSLKNCLYLGKPVIQ